MKHSHKVSVHLSYSKDKQPCDMLQSHKHTFVSKQLKQPTRTIYPLSKQQRASKTDKKSTLYSSRLKLIKVTA